MPSVVGVLNIRLYISDARTLKDKRRVLNSLLDRVGNRFNVSVAEVGRNDYCNSAEIAVACVANEAVHVGRVLDSVLRMVRADRRAVVEDHDVEML